jgi:tripartite ATP-independent transporter DctP family solute receptor
MMKKLLLCVIIASLCVFTVAAAGQRDSATRTYTIDVALHFQAGTTEYYAVQRFGNTVEAGSNGRISVRLYPASALGSEMDNLEQVRTGLVQMSVFGDILPSQLAPEFDPTVVPFIFPTYQDVLDVLAGPLGTRIRAAIEERGNMYLLGIQKRGARKLTASRPVNTPADLAGLKLRVPEIPSWVHVWRGLGALPTPVAFAEVYNALQTGVVDAQENPIQLIHSARFYEVNRYIMVTDHVQTKYHWAINKNFFDSLPAEFQRLVREAADEACAWGDAVVDSREAELITELRRQGVTIIDVNKQLFINAARPHIEQLAQTWDPLARETIQRFFR